jgi:hypothetical protein
VKQARIKYKNDHISVYLSISIYYMFSIVGLLLETRRRRGRKDNDSE